MFESKLQFSFRRGAGKKNHLVETNTETNLMIRKSHSSRLLFYFDRKECLDCEEKKDSLK